MTDVAVATAAEPAATVDPYKGKWSTLSNTTLGMLMASIDASIVLIALPDIFRGIHLNPLLPGNTSYFLWMMMGYMLVTAVLVVSFGRLGDIFGRVRMYNMGFALFTVFSIMLSVTWMHGARRRPVHDRHAHLPGRRRGPHHGQFDGHPDRRLPPQAAWPGSRDQHDGGHRRLVHRPCAGRHPGAHRLAPGVPGLGAGGRRRHRLGPDQPQREGRTHPGQDRLAGQRHLRSRPGGAAHRHRLRHRALRSPHHGLERPLGPGGPDRRRADARACSCGSRPESQHRCSTSGCFASVRSRPATWPASWPPSGAAGSCSCSSSGCRASGCPSTATASLGPRSGPASSCCP